MLDPRFLPEWKPVVRRYKSAFLFFSVKIRLSTQKAFLWLIRGYRYFVSPLLPQSCRFTPTCSRYAIQAIEDHGSCRGILLAFWRILRCHPFCQGGYDPVPPVTGNNDTCQRDCDGLRNSKNKICLTQTRKF